MNHPRTVQNVRICARGKRRATVQEDAQAMVSASVMLIRESDYFAKCARLANLERTATPFRVHGTPPVVDMVVAMPIVLAAVMKAGWAPLAIHAPRDSLELIVRSLARMRLTATDMVIADPTVNVFATRLLGAMTVVLALKPMDLQVVTCNAWQKKLARGPDVVRQMVPVCASLPSIVAGCAIQ